MKKLVIISIFIFLLISISSAHQPRIVSGNFTSVEKPEVSQAFYGELDGNPHYYQIDSEDPYNLYVSLLVPDLKGVDKDVSAEIIRIHDETHNDFHVLLNGTAHNWTRYYEEFGGDYYYRGPELGINRNGGLPQGVNVNKGTYNIKVFSPDNEGKYVLVVGYKETWTVDEFINTILTLPELKSEFFEKSPFTAYFNLIGIFFLIMVAFSLSILIYVGLKLYKYLIKKGIK